MALNLVPLVLNLYDGGGNLVTSGTASLAPTSSLMDAVDGVYVTQAPIVVNFHVGASPMIQIVPTDDPNVAPSGWAWDITFNDVPGDPASYYFQINGSGNVFSFTAAGSTFTAAGSGISDGTAVMLSGSSSLPGGFWPSTIYYVVAASGDTFGLASSAGGTAIAATSSGSGSVALVQYLSSLVQAPVAEAVLPIPISAGGTGETTAAAALPALYGVSPGQTVISTAAYIESGDPDATASINRAIAVAPSGATVQLPAGVVTISGSGIIMTGTDIELTGWGNSTVVQPSASMSAMIQSSSSHSGARIKITNMLLDGLFEATYLIAYNQSAVQGLSCTNVTFRNPGSLAVAIYGAADLKMDHCKFIGNSQTGRPNGTMVEMLLGCRRLKFSYCEFESYINGIIGDSGSNPYDAMIDDVEIDHCYFDGSWWLIPAGTAAQVGTPSNSGGTVTYTATSVTDTAAAFATMPQPNAYNNNIRAMPVRHTGTITTAGELQVTDSAANFNTALSYGSATRGDVVRTASAWAMVEGIESSGTTLRVSQWRSLTTWQPVAAPVASTAYTLYAVLLGNVMSYSGTAITVDQWHDWYGNKVTPPAGTRYEVMTTRPNYAVNFNPGTWNVRVTNSEFFGNWSDQCSAYGQENQIIGNYIHDGQDGGITLQGGDRHIVSGNRIRHQGSCCMFFLATDGSVTGNAFQGAGWVNQSGVGDVEASCQNTTFTGNTFISDSGISGIASAAYGLHLNDSEMSCSENYVAADNIFGGHTVADIYLDGTTGTFGPNEIHARSGTVIVSNGTTPGQILYYTGTGAPLLPATVGSTYYQTDSTGSPLWVYGTGGWEPSPQTTATGGVVAYGGLSSLALALPAGLSVTPAGTTGSTTYGYRIQAAAPGSACITGPCAEVQTTTGNASLSVTNYNTISWTAVPNAVAYNVCGRTAGKESLLAQVTGTSYNDTGAATPASNRNLFTLTNLTPSFIGGTTTGWSIQVGATLAADQTTGPNANGCSLKVITSGSTASGVNGIPGAGITPANQPYTLSFYAKGSGNLAAYLSSAPANGAFAYNVSIPLTSTWTRYSVTATCPVSQTNLYATFECNTATTFWISAIQVEQASTASPYIDTTTAVAMGAVPAAGSQVVAQAWPLQTANPLVVENSSGTSVFSVDPSGDTIMAGTLTSALSSLTPVSVTQSSGTYSASAGSLVKANISGGSWALNLPNAPANFAVVGVKVIANATGTQNALTIACQGSDRFEQSSGGTSATMSIPLQAAVWQYNSGYWTRLSDDLPMSQLDDRYTNIFSPMSFGAIGNGTTDDTTPVLAAFTAAEAANGVVDLGYRTFLTSSAIPLVTGVHLRGSEMNSGGGLVNNTSSLFSITGTVNTFTIENCTLTASAGHVFSCAASSIVGFGKIRGVSIIQNGTAYAIWYMPNGTYLDMLVGDGCTFVAQGGATVAPWTIIGLANCNRWRSFRVSFSSPATTVPFFHIECDSGTAWSSDNTFKDITCEYCAAGIISCLTCSFTSIENVAGYDVTGSYSSSLFSFGAGTGGLRSEDITVRNSGRRGGSLGSGAYDFYAASATQAILLENVGPESGGVASYSMQSAYATVIGGQGQNGFVQSALLAAAGTSNQASSAQTRLVGGSTSIGPPTAGTWQAQDIWTDSAGTAWICVTAGTPGTWVSTISPLAPSGDTTGATDYSTITAAVAALPSAGGVVYLGAGTFYIDAAIIVPANAFVAGLNEYLTIVKVASGWSSSVYPFLIENVSNAGVRDLTVDASSTSGAYAIYALANTVSVTGIDIRRVRVINGGAYGVALVANPNFMTAPTYYTIGGILEDITVTGAATMGINVLGGQSVRVIRPVATSCGNGVYIEFSMDFQVVSAEANGNTTHGLCINYSCSDFVVTGGNFNSNGGYGIIVSQGCIDFTITGPHCNYNTSSGIGVDVLQPATYVTGTATSGSVTTLTDTTKNWPTNVWAGWQLDITGGTGNGETAAITSNTSNTLTFATQATAPASASTYAIDGTHIVYDIGGTISGAVCAYNTGQGIWVDYCQHLNITGCDLHHNTRGVDVVAQYCNITANDIHDNSSYGVTLYVGTDSSTGGHRCTGNLYLNNNSGGVNVYNPANTYPNIVDEYVNLGETVSIITSTNSSWPIPNGANWLEITAVGGAGQGGGGGSLATSTLTTGLTSGSPVTSLAFSANPQAFASGATITVVSGANTQTFTTTAAGALNATSVAVTSVNANYSYPIGSQINVSSWAQVGGGGGSAGTASTQVVPVGTNTTLTVTIGAGGSAAGGGGTSTGAAGTNGSSGSATGVAGTGISVIGTGGMAGNGSAANSAVGGAAGLYGQTLAGAANYGADQGAYQATGGAASGYAAGGGGSGGTATYAIGGRSGGAAGSATAGGLPGTTGLGTPGGGNGGSAAANSGGGGGAGGGAYCGGVGGTGGSGGSGFVIVRVVG